MTICRNPNCAKENPDDIVFCKYCGRRLKEPRNYSKMPLQIVGVFAGFILLLIVIKISFGGQKNNIKPNVNQNPKTNIIEEQTPKPNTAESDLNYKFVFVRANGKVKEIYLHNQNGTIEQLTNSNYENIYPSISPDESKIIFERIEDNKSNIYIMNIDGKGEKKLAEGHGPTWSANGSKIFFYQKDPNSISNFLYSIKSDGTGLNRETMTSDSYSMARISKDGSKIALTKYSVEGWGIYTVGPDFSGRKTLAVEKNEVGNPAWSKEGDHIVFQSKKNGNYDIYSVDLNGNNVRLTESELPDISPSFTPDSKIMFTREEMGTLNLYLMDGNGANQKQVLKDAGYASVSLK